METNTLEFLISQAGRSIRRNGLMTLAAICNMAVSLAILGAFALVAVNLDHMASMQANSTVVTVDLAKGADAQAVAPGRAGGAPMWSDGIVESIPSLARPDASAAASCLIQHPQAHSRTSPINRGSRSS